jgi:hypothetical protein
MKLNLIWFCILLFNFNALAIEDNEVTLVVSGQGKTLDEAKNNALRSAIEQAFGTFISSNSEILNDDLVKDEVVSVSNGNIKKFEVISQSDIPGLGFAISLKATVSVNNLISFVESKGGEVEFKGNLFTFNIKQQILNEENEVTAIADLYQVSHEFLKKSFDFNLSTGNPQINKIDNKEWIIPFVLQINSNLNFNEFYKYLLQL